MDLGPLFAPGVLLRATFPELPTPVEAILHSSYAPGVSPVLIYDSNAL